MTDEPTKRPAGNAENKRLGQERRVSILEFVVEFAAGHGYAPSREEIAQEIGVTKNVITKHLQILESEGKIRIGPGPRMITVLND